MLLLHALDVLYLSNGLLDGHTQIVEVDGLGGKVEGSVVHSLTDVAHVAIGGNHNTLEGGVLHLVNLCEQRQSVHLRHIDVRQDDIVVLVLQQHLEGLQSVVRKRELVFSLAYLTTEVLREQQLEIGLIVDT